jgi:hypothetical protein
MGLGPLRKKTSDFSVLMHFIVAWSVNVAAAANFHGSSAPHAIVLYVIMMAFY